MKIAIDGPSASGKGTISKLLAKKLGLEYLNTGKIYRIIAFLASKMEGDLLENALKVAGEIERHFKEQTNEDAIYTEENAKITSEISKDPQLREILVKFQQDFAKNEKGVILEGRDIGTIILPDADFKFYLDASPEERAKRRVLQLGDGLSAQLSPQNYEKILQDIKQRDKNDTERQNSALKIAQDAHYIDTTHKNIEGVIEEILKIIKG